jgi:precorrin-2/cobalt-factor-2 C20-methyltransferase
LQTISHIFCGYKLWFAGFFCKSTRSPELNFANLNALEPLLVQNRYQIASLETKRLQGKFYGIGVGPGDPDLITLKGLKALQNSAVVAFPAGRGGKPGMAEAIAAQFLQPTQGRLPLELPFVQDKLVLRAAWQTAVLKIAQHIRQGQNVSFIAEGDVSFYSTLTYLMWGLKAQYPDVEMEIIPGVCSPMASAAAIGIPLTIWSDKLAVLPAMHSLSELETALDWAEVVVLMKVSSVYQEVWRLLRSRKLLHHSHVVAWATLPQQKVWSNLTQFPDLDLPYFSLLIVSLSTSML